MLRDRVQKLHPAYFALVMATGIVATACYLLDMVWLAWALTVINVLAYVILWGLTIARLAMFPGEMLADLNSHGRGVGFFTIVAGTCVLGSQFYIIPKIIGAAAALWVIGLVLWLVLNYSILIALTLKTKKPSLEKGIHGGWLLAVVATQAVANLAGLLAGHASPPLQRVMLFFSLGMWLYGGMLYIWLISLIFYRYTFYVMSPEDLMPPYWINMGAMAISTLAGTTLIFNAGLEPFLEELLPFLKGFTILFWATATWWIPMLVAMGYWRHVLKRHRIRYEPLFWGLVFPLGMYTACTFQLSRALDLAFLAVIPRWFIWLALAAWAMTFFGLMWDVVNALVARTRGGSDAGA